MRRRPGFTLRATSAWLMEFVAFQLGVGPRKGPRRVALCGPTAPRPVDAGSAKGLTKRYDDLVAVDGLDLTIPTGVCFGLLGPNGAGKTTTIRMILGQAPPTAGSLEV